MDIKALTSKKVAGIPVVYLAAALALILLYMAIRMRGAKAETPTDTAATDESGRLAGGLAGDFANPDQPQFAAGPRVLNAYPNSGGSGGSSTYVTDTNEQWARRALEWLISPQGAETYDSANSALSKFLRGDSLSTPEARVRDKAIARFGLPPEAVDYSPIGPDDTGNGGTDPTGPPTPDPVDPPSPPDPVDPPGPIGPPDPLPDPDPPPTLPPVTPPVVTPPTLPPVTPPPVVPPTLPPPTPPSSSQGVPPTGHQVKGTSDDSAGELSNLYYHRNDNDAQGLIRSANAERNWSSPIPVGTRLWIPEWREPVYFKATATVRSVVDIAAKNGTTPEKLRELNPNKQFPVDVGTMVRVK